MPVSDGKARSAAPERGVFASPRVANPRKGRISRPNFAALRRAWGFEESIASFAAQAAAKLRRHGLLAAGCNIYAQVFAAGGGGDFVGRTVAFPAYTDATNEMLRAFRPETPALFTPGLRYRKTGVVFFGLEKPGTPQQTDLFAPVQKTERSRLYKAVDALNARYGKGKVFSAAEGIGPRSWQMKRSKLSKRASTRWDELMVVK